MGARLRELPLLLVASFFLSSATSAGEPAGLDQALTTLARQGKFSGAVVIRGSNGIRFARGYGMADPFTGRAFTPDTQADSGSLAKPITSAAVLLLARDGKLQLDEPVRRYLAEFPFPAITIRQLLSHSAGLALQESPEALANQDNASLIAAAGEPLFVPGSAFNYCNLCGVALAMLIERVSGMHYLDFVRTRLAVPTAMTLRPQRLADWKDRAIGYRRTPEGTVERFDSWEGERLYGPANLSLSALALAEWGIKWWQPELQPLRQQATEPAIIQGNSSGLTLGNWYCGPKARCHYLGHHEGFHHMLYWDARKRLSVAMLSNNALDPALQQRLQRAIVAFANGVPQIAMRELSTPLRAKPVPTGRFTLPSGETVEVKPGAQLVKVRRRGIDYPAYPVASGIRYVPGLDVYVSGTSNGQLEWLSLYEDFQLEKAVH